MPQDCLESRVYQERIEAILPGDSHERWVILQELSSKLEASVKSEHIEPVVSILDLLGTTVGRDKTWQSSYRENGILDFALRQLLVIDTASELNKQCLRVIGNSVADNDTNRQIVLSNLAKLISCISIEELSAVALIVLFNLCNDFDSAKAAAAMSRLDVIVVENIVRKKLLDTALDYALELLIWTTEHLTTAQLKTADSLKVFKDLLKIAIQSDQDHYDEYVVILLHYLQDVDFQMTVAIPDLLDSVLDLMLDFEIHFRPEEIEAVFMELSTSKVDGSNVSQDDRICLLTQLIHSVSAISATDAFLKYFNLESLVIRKIRDMLQTRGEFPSTVCACIMLGNLAMSDAICIDMVNITELHVTLIEMLSSSKNSAILFAAAGFVRHLAFPEMNRSKLARAGLLQTCCILLERDDSSIRGEAAAILRKLITDNFENIIMFVYHEREEALPTAINAAKSLFSNPTLLEHIVVQALCPWKPLPSTAMKNPVIELGRAIVVTLRYLSRPNAEQDTDAVREDIFRVPRVVRPIADLVQQRFYTDARSEGLLGLGLSAQSPTGALCVIEEIKENQNLLEAIKELACGHAEGVNDQHTRANKDAQNAMVLLQTLLNNASLARDAEIESRLTMLQEELARFAL